MRRVPRSSPLRRRTENTLTADIVATTRIFASAESIADVIFSSPCCNSVRPVHLPWKPVPYLNENLSNKSMSLAIDIFMHRRRAPENTPDADFPIPETHHQSGRRRGRELGDLRETGQFSMVLFAEFAQGKDNGRCVRAWVKQSVTINE